MGDAGEPEWCEVVEVPPELEAVFLQRVSLLLGLVPLAEMTQGETDWVFRQRVRLANDED